VGEAKKKKKSAHSPRGKTKLNSFQLETAHSNSGKGNPRGCRHATLKINLILVVEVSGAGELMVDPGSKGKKLSPLRGAQSQHRTSQTGKVTNSNAGKIHPLTPPPRRHPKSWSPS